MEPNNPNSANAAFATTHWSRVLRAGENDSTELRAAALNTLCQDYWYPLYVYIRRLGHSPHDAQDLTQGFFAYLLSQDLLKKANPDFGRFRSFLLASLNNFMSNEWRRENAQKRRPPEIVHMDLEDAENRYTIEPDDPVTPQTLFEQTWAIAVMEQSSRLLQQEYTHAGKSLLFDLLSPMLQGERQPSTYRELGQSLGLTEAGVKTAVHRLRARYRELLRATVADTVPDPLEIEAELRHLARVLGQL